MLLVNRTDVLQDQLCKMADKKSDNAVVKCVTDVLQLEPDVLTTLFEALVAAGVEELDDLQFVEEDDINKVLKPVQVRRLLKAWKGIYNFVMDFL